MILNTDIITIEVKDREGNVRCIEAPTDMALNLMETCKINELDVEGTCGGMALCASCHIYVLSEHSLGQPSIAELDMLDQAFFVKSNSRLACQIRITEEIHNLKVELAPVAI